MERQTARKDDGRIMRGEATRERVLDAAERLFADHGFDAVSIRQIAREAGVTLGVVGFHSGSKEDLFTTILRRRVEALSKERLRRLERMTARGARPSLRDLMAAYIGSYVDFAASGNPQWFAYARVIAITSGDARWYPMVRHLYDPVARSYLAEIARLYPEASPRKLAGAFVMSVAAMLATVASTVRMEALAGEDGPIPADSVENLERQRETLVDFCTGGIERAIRSGAA